MEQGVPETQLEEGRGGVVSCLNTAELIHRTHAHTVHPSFNFYANDTFIPLLLAGRKHCGFYSAAFV